VGRSGDCKELTLYRSSLIRSDDRTGSPVVFGSQRRGYAAWNPPTNARWKKEVVQAIRATTRSQSQIYTCGHTRNQEPVDMWRRKRLVNPQKHRGKDQQGEKKTRLLNPNSSGTLGTPESPPKRLLNEKRSGVQKAKTRGGGGGETGRRFSGS